MQGNLATHWLQLQAVIHKDSSLQYYTDEQLALGLQQGEAACLTPLVERYHNPVLGFLYRLCAGDRALAEDLVQETFLRFIHNIGKYRHPRPLRPWLYTIAVNLARDHYKSADRRRTDSMTEAFEVATEAALDDPLFSAEDARQVARAIAALPAHQRETIILRYYQDLSLNEIADILHIPTGTVKSRLSLGLKQLRERLEPVL